MSDTDDRSAVRRDHNRRQSSTQTGFIKRFLNLWDLDKGDVAGDDKSEIAGDSSSSVDGMLILRQLRVQDVTIPKADIQAVEQNISRQELVEIFRESGLTRLPVYDGTLDVPVGFIHLKDFALTHGFNGQGDGVFDLGKLLRPLLFVPPSMPVEVLLRNMQAKRIHMALVIDEYGGVDGLVTIEDLIEQVIGEIEDEHDENEGETWWLEKPGCYSALAKTSLSEFESVIERSLTAHDGVSEEDIDTLGGLVFMLAGRVPARGEVVVHPEGFEFEVIDGDARRIKRLRVRTSRVTG